MAPVPLWICLCASGATGHLVVFNITLVEILRASKSKKGIFFQFSSNFNKIINIYKCFECVLKLI
jgi:hypothetical protein